ncbi:hypothetical protein A8B78_05345 [Jannaschia sp. EhC01]|nr:hypothetical protein A8B78_05345 [Jannaschia sp. EhC01]
MRLWLAEVAEKPALARSYAAYMAELCPGDATTNDPYFERYWQEPSARFPYRFGNDAPQGFAFVRIPQEPDLDFEMAEFCVDPVHRRHGLGVAILPLLFARHPGRWEVSVLMSNGAGLAFWPKALRKAAVQDLRMREDDIARDYRFTAH